jgi:hypothetical protein
VAADCPVSIQTLLDVASSIRNLSQSFIDRVQQQHEDKVSLAVTSILYMHIYNIIQCRIDMGNTSQNSDQQQQPANITAGDTTRRSRQLYTEAFSSVIVSDETAADLISALPSRLQLETPILLFRLTEDGTSIARLWTKVGPCVYYTYVIYNIDRRGRSDTVADSCDEWRGVWCILQQCVDREKG